MGKHILVIALICMGISVVAGPKARARLDINGMGTKVKLLPLKAKKGYIAANPGWVKDEEQKKCYIFSQGKPLSEDEWTDYEVSFIPSKDGKITIYLMGNYQKDPSDPEKKKLIPLWVCWDDVLVEGANALNGTFDEENDKGIPSGWNTKKENYIKKDGKKYVKAWHNGRVSQTINVKKAKTVKITARVKAAKADE